MNHMYDESYSLDKVYKEHEEKEKVLQKNEIPKIVCSQ
jgi:hypothetical protein